VKYKNYRKNPNMIVTPISKNPKSKANIDYHEQLQRIHDNLTHMWDDSRYCHAIQGDLFAYIENSVKLRNNDTSGEMKTPGKIMIYIILDVHSPSKRLPSWSCNVGQGDRNVLELTDKPIYEGTAIEWKNYLGYKENYNVQGTIHIDNSKLISYIRDKLE